MSAEKNLDTEVNNLPPLETSQKSEALMPERVDINILLHRARKIQEKQNFTNIVFFCLFAALIVISGIILSL
jgi:hypothetical protein